MQKEQTRIQSDGKIFEGIVSVRTIVGAMEKKSGNDRRIEKIFLTRERAAKNAKEYAWLLHRAEELGFETEIAEQEYIDALATGNSHGGLICRCSERTFRDVPDEPDFRFAVMLDGIEDPYNFGYALRSVYGAGADAVILPERNWMEAGGIVCRASAGASELLDIYVSDPEAAVKKLKNVGMKIVCADLRDSVSIYDAGLKYPLLLVVGGEKRGISRSVLSQSDVNVRIPYGREFEASLSAASATAIAAFEIMRQNL